MNRFLTALLVALVLFSYASGAPASVIVNGDFSQAGTPPEPFDGWTTYDYPNNDRPSDGGGFALFEETGALFTQLEQTFTLPAGALLLTFEFMIESVQAGQGTAPNLDSFQATLWDSNFDTLFPSDPSRPNDFLAFYSIDDLGDYFDPIYVTTAASIRAGFTRVTLDVSSLSPQDLTLDFQLNSFDDGWATKVSLDNVELTTRAPSVVPAPHGVAIWAGLFGMALVARCRSRRQGYVATNG